MLTFHCNRLNPKVLASPSGLQWYTKGMIIEVPSEESMRHIGRRIGSSLKGGEVFELIGDVGAGKTTFTKGLAEGLGVTDEVQSPSFTVSRVYEARDGIVLSHYDFYRLTDAGILANEVAEAVADPKGVTVIEWADIIDDVLPASRSTIRFTATSETARSLILDDSYLGQGL